MKKKFFLISMMVCAVFVTLFFSSCVNNNPPTPSDEKVVKLEDSISFPNLDFLQFKNVVYMEDASRSISFQIEDNYKTKSDFQVLANNQVITPANGVYTISNINEIYYIKIEGAYTSQFEISGKNLPQGVNLTGLTKIPYGHTAEFKIEIDSPYSKSQFQVSANNAQVVSDIDGIFKVENVIDNVEVEVSGVCLNNYALSYEAGQNGEIQGEKNQTLSHGQAATQITAVPDENFLFSVWSDGVTTISRTDLAVKDFSVTAIFVAKTLNFSFRGNNIFSVHQIVDDKVIDLQEAHILAYGESLSFIITLSEKYSQSRITVLANGKEIQPVEGVYNLNNIINDINLEIDGLQLNKYSVNFLNQEGVRFVYEQNSNLNLLDGQDFSFSVELDSAFSNSDIVIKANNVVLTEKNGVYTIENINEYKSVAAVNVQTNLHKITFDSAGGYEVADAYYLYNEKITSLPKPLKNGFRFVCWKEKETNLAFDSAEGVLVVKDMTFVAEYQKATPIRYEQDVAIIISATDGQVIVADVYAGIIIKKLFLTALLPSEIKEIIMSDYIEETYSQVDMDYAQHLEKVTFSKNLKSVSEGAFRNCSNLKSVIINSDLQFIGKNAFSYCFGLEEVYIKSVKEIKENAFLHCDHISTFFVGKETEKIENYAFLNSSIKQFDFGNKITYIGKEAFFNAGLEGEIVLPDSLQTIDEKAFGRLQNITNIIFGKGKLSVGDFAFEGCSLTTINVPSNVVLGKSVFYNSSNLISATVANLSENMFGLCVQLAEVVITENVEVFPKQVFFGTNSLSSIVYPKSSQLKRIEAEAFRGAGLLASKEIELSIYGNSLCFIGKNSFYQAKITDLDIKTNEELILDENAFSGSQIVNIKIPENTVQIGKDAFTLLNNPTQNLNLHLPEGLKRIEQGAFYGLKIQKIIFPQSIEFIGENAFADLGSVDYRQLNLQVVFLGEIPPTISPNSFSVLVGVGGYFGGSVTIYVNKNVMENYTNNQNFVSYNIVPIAEEIFEYEAKFENGVDGTLITITKFFKDAYISAPSKPLREHYEFLGWSETGSENNLFDFSQLALPQDICLQAVWKPVEYIIKYELNGGINFEGNKASYTVEESVSFEDAIKIGHTFVGWFENADFAGEKVLAIRKDEARHLVLYAKFIINTYMVTFEIDENIPKIIKVADYNQTTTPPPNPEKTGFYFEGWKEQGQENWFDFETKILKNTTICAIWKTDKFALILNSNAGKFEDGENLKEIKIDYLSKLVLNQIPTKKGYDFAGWVFEDGSQVLENATMPSESLLVFATWKPLKVDVIFNSDGGDVNYTKKTEFGQTLGELLTPSKQGFSFLGWFDEEKNGFVSSQDRVDVLEQVVLIAKWKENTYTIRYVNEWSQGQMADQKLTYTEIATLNQNQLYLTGHTFSHWRATFPIDKNFNDGDNVQSLISVDGVIINFIPVWIANKYTITFTNDVGASGEMSSINAEYGYSVVLPVCRFQKEGYYFGYWKFKTQTFTAGQVVGNLTEENNAVVNLVAEFRPEARTISFNTNGGNIILSKQVVFDEVIELETPEKEGNIFLGWFSTLNGEGKFESPYVVKENLVMYALWRAKEYEVSFWVNYKDTHEHGNDEEYLFQLFSNVTHNSIITILNRPTSLIGKEFLYWKTENGDIYYSDIDIVGNLNLYAVWSEVEIQITQVDYTGEFVLVSAKQTLSLTQQNIVLYNQYIFEGFYEDEDFTNFISLPFTTTQSVRVFAKYTKSETDLEFEFKQNKMIARLNSNAENVVVPDYYNAYKVSVFDANNKQFSSLKLGNFVLEVYGLENFIGEDLTLNDKTKNIDFETLKKAPNLKNIFLQESIIKNENTKKYKAVEGVLYALISDGINFNEIAFYPQGKDAKDFVLPQGVNQIGNYAFAKTNLQNLEVSTLIKIGEFAFADCVDFEFDFENYTGQKIKANAFLNVAITSLNVNTELKVNGLKDIFEDELPQSLETIHFIGRGEITKNMIVDSTSVLKITLSGYDTIGASAFVGFSNLVFVEMENVVRIEDKAFFNLRKLQNCVLPNSLTWIGNSSFEKTTSLIYSQMLNTLSFVGNNAFFESSFVDGITQFNTDTDISFGDQSLFGAKLESLTTSFSVSELSRIFGTGFKENLTTLIFNGKIASGFENSLKLSEVEFGENVEIIDENAFKNTKITQLLFVNDIKILNSAFANCNNLASLIAKANVNVFSGAFENCGNLNNIDVKSIQSFSAGTAPFENTNPEHVKISLDHNTVNSLFGTSETKIKTLIIYAGNGNIVDNAFKNGMANEVVISDGITKIGKYAFANNKRLKDLVIPTSVTQIDVYVLKDTKLTKLSISARFVYEQLFSETSTHSLIELIILESAQVDTVQKSAYKNVNSLVRVVLPSSIKKLEESAFEGCGLLSDIDTQYLTNINAFALKGTRVSGLNLQNLQSLGTESLALTEINNLRLPLNLQVQYGALFGIDNLESLVLGNTNKPLAYFINSDSKVLRKITVLENVKDLTDNAFAQMKNVFSIILPESLETIGNNAFLNCTSLTKIYLSNNLKTIGNNAFEGCASLSEVGLPFDLKSVGSYAFANCVRLESVEIKSQLSVLNKGVFYNCKSLMKINLPESIERIEEKAFYNNTKLLQINLPVKLTSIGDFAFYNNTVLSNIVFPGVVSVVGAYSFYGCASFTEITISSSVEEIGDYAFAMCIKATKIKISDRLKSLGQNILTNNTQLAEITLPSQLAISQLFEKENIPPLLNKITYSRGNMIVANHALDNLLTISEVVLEEGIMKIGEKAFYNCQTLTKISLPSSLLEIGDFAFSKTSIKNINLNEKLQVIGIGAFEWCFLLEEIVLPERVMTINEDAFYGCQSLARFDFGQNSKLARINDYAFMRCSMLQSINLPKSLVQIGDWAFSECKLLSNISFEEGSKLEYIGNYAFKDCLSLQKFSLPVSVAKLGWGVFLNCKNLERFLVITGRDEYSDVSQNILSFSNLGIMIFEGTLINSLENIDFIGIEVGSYEERVFSKYFEREEK